MTISLADLNPVLKYDYQGPIREILNNSTPFLTQIKKSSKEVVGKGLVIPLHKSRNSGTGARGTTGTGYIPTAGKQGYQEVTVNTKDNYCAISIYGKTMRGTRNDKGAFLRALDSELEGAAKDSAIDVERQIVAGDTSGTLCTTVGSATSATVTCTSTQFLEEGMNIDVGADTNLTISTIDSATQFTLSASITWANAEVVKKYRVTSGDELFGLYLMLNNSNSYDFMGLNVTTYPWWKAKSVGTEGAPVALSELDMLEANDAIDKAGGECDYIITGHVGRRAFFNLLQSQKRFSEASNKMKLKGGFNALVWSAGDKDIPIAVNRYWRETATESSMGFLSLKECFLGRMCNWEWIEEDGNILARQTGTDRKEIYEGTMVADIEFCSYARNHNAGLWGIAGV